MHEQNDNVYTRLSGSIGQLVLNRPNSRNAISREMWLSIPQHLGDLQKQGATLIVISGVGESFAAGADIMELKELENFQDAKQNWDAIANTLDFLYRFELPTIAAVDGACLGGGCLLACACDLRYASQRASFSVPIARLGIALDDANLGRLAALVGVGRAKEMIYRARLLSATEALNWGLVNDVFEVDDFEEKFEAVVLEITANSPVSIREAKASFARFLDFVNDPQNHERVVESYLLPDFQKRIKRALEKE